MKRITIPKPYNMHVHFRKGEMMQNVVPYTARHFTGALVMPNTRPEAILTPNNVSCYHQEIMVTAGTSSGFTPYMTFEIRENTDPAIVESMGKAQAIAGKVYPRNLTTNAEHGVRDYAKLAPVFREMQRHGIVLCLHGEHPGDDVEGLDREARFVEEILPFIATQFSDLRIVLEHITTRIGRDAALRWSNVHATITVQHLLYDHDDAGGDRLNTTLYCKPILKRRQDREALIEAATWGHPKFMFGSDSAPHPREGKESAVGCCAGVFSEPVALPLLAQVFDNRGALDRLRQFTHDNAVKFYGLTRSDKTITLVKQPMKVPAEYHGIIPICAGQEIPWSVEGET